MKNDKQIKVGVVGVSGYTGLELVKMLVSHSGFDLRYLATTTGDTTIEQLHPALETIISQAVEKVSVDEIIQRCELVFLALPHKASMGLAKELIDKGIKIVDLSADYRLELDNYEKHYCTHEDKAHLDKAIYGLIEYYREDIKRARLVAGPGCYPTATLLGLLPFMSYIDTAAPIFIDAKSGISGAGKGLSKTTHFVNINDNSFAYNPLKHRHAPEITEKIHQITGHKTRINFVPHLIPLTRGELVSVYATLKKDIDPVQILEDRYANDHFVRIQKQPPAIKDCAGTHFCDIFASTNDKTLFVSSAIDNILRGASSQALVAANLMCGYDETLGIPDIAYIP